MKDSRDGRSAPEGGTSGPTKGPTRRAWNSSLPAPSKPMKRGKPIRARNAKRGGHRFPKHVDEPYREWIRSLPCCVTGKYTGERDEPIVEPIGDPDFPMWTRINVEAAHVRSRGAGGRDRGNLVPLTWRLHREQHRTGIKTFQAKYNVDLAAIAADLASRRFVT